jgi:predicted aspartyl protease
MFSYDTESEPITPYFNIRVINPRYPEKYKDIQAIIDTGADASCIPLSLVKELGMRYTETTVLDFRKKKVSVTECRASIRINDQDFQLDVVYCIPDDVALIGRDIFNEYKVVLNAPSQRWGINCSCEEGGCILSKSE